MTTSPKQSCCYCAVRIIGTPAFSIHRDGFGEGPELPLCEACGGSPTPTCEEIWARTSRTEQRA